MKRKGLFFLFFTLIFLNLSDKVLAETNPLGFVVEPIYSDNQIDTEKPYFYVKTTPGEEQELKVKVTGTSESPVKIKSFVSNAITSEFGSIDYVRDQSKDSSLKDSIEEIATVDNKEFTLAKNEEKTVTILIKNPAEHYEGIKLGTIYFKRVDQNEEKSKNQIKNEYSFRMGILLSETDKIYNDGQSLNFTKVEPKLIRSKKAIVLTLQNPESKMITDFNMKVKILVDQGKIVKEQSIENGSIAPNSSFDYAFDWGIDTLKSGKYTVKISATSKHKSWNLEKNFEITQEIAKEMNNKTLYKLFLPKWAYVVTVFLGVSTLVCSVVIKINVANINTKKKKVKK